MTPAAKLRALLSTTGLVQGSDGVFAPAQVMPSLDQQAELRVRERDAARHYDDYLFHISHHSSIPVMDAEVARFLERLPRGATVLDIGGCFGWHWRTLATTRPDVGVVIVDFVRRNLFHARQVLGSLVDSQVVLVHADATALPFAGAEGYFDGVWTVQVFQHIPAFDAACREVHRVLKPGGLFTMYLLHAPPLIRMAYRLLGRPYHLSGLTRPGPGQMHLNRASDRHRQTLAGIFSSDVQERYTECLFHTEFRLTFTGKANSWIGRLDAHLGNHPALGRWMARQRSFEIAKPLLHHS